MFTLTHSGTNGNTGIDLGLAGKEPCSVYVVRALSTHLVLAFEAAG